MMNLWQFHLIGRADDTYYFEMQDLKGHQIYGFALQTRVRWLKNLIDERKCPDQIILGANDPNWCILIHMAVYLESFLTMHPGAKYLFTDSLLENGPNNLKSSWQNTLKKVVWSDPQFKDCQPELDNEEDSGIGTHSNQKFAANFTSHSGCTC